MYTRDLSKCEFFNEAQGEKKKLRTRILKDHGYTYYSKYSAQEKNRHSRGLAREVGIKKSAYSQGIMRLKELPGDKLSARYY